MAITMEKWIDRHSVNCFICGELVDERECIPNPDRNEGGDICPKCQKKYQISVAE